MDIRELPVNRQKEVLDKLYFFLKGDENAINFCLELLFSGHLWDDLIDKDKPRTDTDINHAFSYILGELHFNPFYMAFAPVLNGLIANAAFLWQESNVLAGGGNDEKFMSFITRNALMELVHFCMVLMGGGKWALENGPDFWRFFGQGIEGKYREFLQEVDHA